MPQGSDAEGTAVLMSPRAKRKLWSPEELDAVQRTYPHLPTAEIATQLGCSAKNIYRVAARLGLKKTAAFLASPVAYRLRRGDNVGADFRFKPGHVPANKGMKMPGWAPGRMAETQFKCGQIGNKYMPIGTERVNPDGYRERKVTDTLGTPRDWKGVQILVWEEAHGPVPAGRVVIFKDGDKANIVLENLECLSRRDLMLRNSSQRWGPEVFGLIQLRGALNRKIRSQREK
jgi:hypothetical protein